MLFSVSIVLCREQVLSFLSRAVTMLLLPELLVFELIKSAAGVTISIKIDYGLQWSVFIDLQVKSGD